jgi:tetratricopeptide (TPR) repeat protein
MGSQAFPGTSRFEPLQQLGAGGMGIVYAAFDRERNARVALKTLPSFTPESLSRFKNEFRSIQDIRHPNLVNLDELMEADGTWFFTMELVDGVDFLAYVAAAAETPSAPRLRLAHGSDATGTMETQEARPLSGAPELALGTVDRPARPYAGARAAGRGRHFDEARLRDALAQLVVGISALHDAGKVHRDIKPSNILVTANGRVVVLDFGLIGDPGVFEKGAGTVKYMAPEQASGEAVGPAADWYGVGVTLYAALTGNVPFVGQVTDILARKLDSDPAPPSKFDVDVPEDLEELCMALLRRNPAERPGAREILARLGVEAPASAASAPGAAPFVGRAAELGVLTEALAAVGKGRVALVVEGESGVGKSALVRHFLDQVSARGHELVLAARCYERESVPYKAVDQVLEALANHLALLPEAESEPLLPPRMALVAEVFPAFQQLESVAEQVIPARARKSDPSLDRVQVFVALRELFTRVARGRRLVVAIDDLQWADGDSLALLAEVLRAPDAPPLLFLATVRCPAGALPAPVQTLQTELGGDRRELRVERLPGDAARELVERLCSSVGAREPLAVSATALAEEAGGHPMFIDALVRHRVAHPDATGPMRLDDALVARTDALGVDVRHVLELVCVAGGPVPQEACALALGQSFAELADRVGRLRASNLVKTQGIRRSDVVEPYHDRVREALVAAVAPAARTELHARLARALEQGGAADPEALARHFREGGDPRKAARYATRAAERAQAAFAFDRAAQLYRQALELDPGPPAQELRLRTRLGEALGHAGRGTEAAEVYLAATAEASADDALELRRMAAAHYLRAGRITEGLATLDSVLATVGMSIPRGRGAAMVAFLAERWRLGRRGLAYVPRAAADVPRSLQHVIDVLVSMYPLGLTDVLRGHRFQTMNLRLSLDSGVPANILRALATEIIYQGIKGPEATAQLQTLLDLAQRLLVEQPDPLLRGAIETAGGAAATVRGEWKVARERCERGERLLREECTGAVWELDTAMIYGTRTLFYLGELAELKRLLPQRVREAHERGDLYLATNLGVGYSMVHMCLADDDGAAARRQSVEALAKWTYAGTHLPQVHDLLGQTCVDLYEGDHAAAEARLAASWPEVAKTMYLRMDHMRILFGNLRARVALVAAAARPAGSKERAQRVAAATKIVRALRREKPAWGQAICALTEASLACASGDVASATARFADAERQLAAVDMALHAAAARRQQGVLAGGDAGAALVADADAFMRGQGIRRPERFAELFAPGLAFVKALPTA